MEKVSVSFLARTDHASPAPSSTINRRSFGGSLSIFLLLLMGGWIPAVMDGGFDGWTYNYI